jgi:O-antigen ligase
VTRGDLLWRAVMVPLFIWGVLPAALLFYPALLLGLFIYAYVLRGGLDVVWYLNLTLITLLLTCASVALYLLRGRRISFRPCMYDYLVLMLAALVFLGSLYTPDPMAGLIKTARLGGLVVLPYFLARVILVTPRRLHLLASTILYLAVAIAGVLVVTQLAPEAVPQFLAPEPEASTRAQFIDTNQVPLATFLALGVILAVIKGREHGILFTIPATALLLYAMSLTGTRSPFLALSVVGVIYLASMFVRSPARATLVIAGVSLGLAFLVSTELYQALPNWQRFESAATSQDIEASSIQVRKVLADQAIAMFLDNPLTGGGTASFPGYPHNIFLELAAENGIFGVAVMFVLVLLVAGRTWAFLFAYKLKAEERTVAALVVLPFIALLVVKQFSFGLDMHKDLFIFLAAAVNLPQLVSRAAGYRQFSPPSAAHQAPPVPVETSAHSEASWTRSPRTGGLGHTGVREANS